MSVSKGVRISSINPHYTFNYSQPEEYRLSHDSVFLSRRVFEKLQGVDLSQTKALDICAGAGVVGMDFLFHRRAEKQTVPMSFDFLEVQDIYIPHFNENKIRLGPIDTALNFELRNYNDLQEASFHQKYDLILSAPPYFLPTDGKLSPSEFKNRCKFFIDSDLRNLILGICNCLKKSGVAYILLRDLPDHKIDVIREAEQFSQGSLQMTVLGDIRGTHFIEFRSKEI